MVACGDPALTDTEYRDLVEDRAAAHAEETELLRSSQLLQLKQAVDDLIAQTDGADVEAAVVAETGRRSASLFSAVADAVARYAADLAALSPPESIVEAHDEYVAALELSISNVGVTVDRLAGAASFEEIDAAIGDSSFSDTRPRVDAACRNLEKVMADQGVRASLQCS